MRSSVNIVLLCIGIDFSCTETHVSSETCTCVRPLVKYANNENLQNLNLLLQNISFGLNIAFCLLIACALCRVGRVAIAAPAERAVVWPTRSIRRPAGRERTRPLERDAAQRERAARAAAERRRGRRRDGGCERVDDRVVPRESAHRGGARLVRDRPGEPHAIPRFASDFFCSILPSFPLVLSSRCCSSI